LWRKVGRRRLIELFAVALLVAIPLATGDEFLADRLGSFMLYAIFALSVDLIWGYGGMLSFGHAAFFGWGGYVVAILMTRQEALLPLSFWTALPLAMFLPGMLAYILGWFAFSGRLAIRGVYFAVLTLALSVLSAQIAEAGGTLTGGHNGIILLSTISVGQFDFEYGFNFYVLAASVLIASYAALRWYVRSKAGLRLLGVRENEERLLLLGVDVAKVKRRAFTLSAGLAALAGAFFYAHNGIVSPSAVGIQLSTQVLLWVLIGGLGTLLGPVVGAVGLSYLTAELSGTLLNTWLLVVGVVLVVVILFVPSGLMGFFSESRLREGHT
jgi:urea ABC transporter permease protein UrtC